MTERERVSNVEYNPSATGRPSRERNSNIGYNPTFNSKASRDSQGGSGPGTTDVDFDVYTHQSEYEYPAWWTRRRIIQDFFSLCEDPYWNSFICVMALAGIVWVAVAFNYMVFIVLDIVYNISYAIHVFGLTYSLLMRMEASELTFYKSLRFLVDVATFSHYVSQDEDFKLLCYYLRLHRPFSYLWALNDKNLKSSVLGTTLKFCYIFFVMRVTWALIWLNIDSLERTRTFEPDAAVATRSARRALDELQQERKLHSQNTTFGPNTATTFLNAFYLINKMYIPIGTSVPPANDIERLACLAIMLSGCLSVAIAVASLALVVSLYMRPEETFRARYRLIIKEMKDSNVAPSQRDRVETFYKMYWHKQRAVSATQLLPLFPPTLPATIFTDVYFEATQKSKILCDLSYQFLSELSKKMETIHYIPGDSIIKRLSNKCSYIYITYGDVELVTAEDDSTAILRLTRGSVLTPCAVCAPAGLGRAHLEVRAATFCTAHVLKAKDLWKVVIKHGRTDEETEIILGSYNDHLERVKTHFKAKVQEEVKHKSSIFHFKRCLLALKEAKDANGKLLLARTDVFLEIADSYIMRNRADSTLTDESDAICLRPTFPYILQPTSSLQNAWNLFTCTIIVAVCFAHPYFLVFRKTAPIEFRLFDYLVTVVYVFDLFVHLSTGANVEEGVPITLAQTSSQQMRSHWFVLDVLGTAPIFEFIGNGHFAGINKLLRVPKVFRVLKTLEESCVYQSHILRFMSYTLLLLISCYLIAALQQGFMCYQFGYCQVTNMTHSPYWEHKPLDDDTIQNRVAFAMYWAISMIIFTAHMETWGTENWKNVLYTLIVLEVCIVLRLFMEAVYSATILVTTALREDYDAAITVVKNFMIRNQVDPVLRKRFISYLQLCWYTDKAYAMTNKRSIFYDLPPHVFQDIVAKQRSKYILALPFMKYVSQVDLKHISSKAKLFYTSPHEILLNTGDISNEMYVIKQGICEILSPATHSVVGLLNAKCHFGVLGCLLRIPSYYTIRTVTNVQVFSISRKYLLHAIEVPHIKDTLDFSRRQPEFQRLQARTEPFLSYVVPDPIPNREMFKLPRKHEADNDFLLPFYRLGFFSILRYIFPRFTIRPDGTYLIRYEWFRASCAMASAIVFPGYTYLSIQWPWLYYVAQLLDLSAIVDILQRMLIAYYDETGILIYHPSSTAAHYMKGAFFADLFGCLALENLEAARIEGDKVLVTQMEQFLMMNRLMQLYRVPSAMLLLKNFTERRDILIVFKAIPLFIVLLNVLTSFMVLYSVKIYRYLNSDEWLIVPLNDKGGSWVHLFGSQFRFNLTESPFNLHLGTYFWMVYEVSTTGYNNIKPSNVHLIRLLFSGMLICAMLLTYFSVKIISIRANVNKDLAEFQEHMKDMVAYMKREIIKPELQKVVLDYYEYTWDKMGGVDYRNMFKLCAQITLRTDAILHIYGPTFAKCPILTHTDISLMRIIGRAVHSAYFLRGMNIVEANDVISDMYFVDYGGVDARETVGELSTLTKLPKGSVFGNLDGAETVCCPLTFVATSRVHLLMINSATFHNVINDFPAVRELMRKFRSNESYILGNVVEGRTSMSQHHQSFTVSPFMVTSRKGLIKHLYFKDKYIQIFLIIISLVCVYLDVYNAGFQDNSMWLIIVLYSLDFCFYFKILLHYTQPLIVDSANIRRLLLPQRKAYFKGEFRYDLLSCIPLELLSFLSTEYRWRIFACLRLNRMFRIVTVYKGITRHQERITINLPLTTGLAAICWFTLFVHCTSCLWYFIGHVEESHQKKSSWIYKDDGSSWCRNEYICSMYFVLTTFTQNGVGDIMPKKQFEVIYVIILQIVSAMMYMIYVGEFSNIIQYQSFRACSFYSKYLELQEFLKNNRVSKNLVNIVNKYSLHMWRATRGMQEPHFLKTAPQALRLEIMSACYLHHLTRHHVFENCEMAFLRQLVGCLQLLTYNEDMYVVKSSEITDSMYLIHTGKIEEIADETHKVPRIYPAGSYFGVVQGLMHDLPYTHSYRTQLKSQVLTLRLDDWLYLLKHYPSSRKIIKQHMTHDQGGDGGGGGGGGGFRDDHWKKKIFTPKPKRDQKGRRVTVVTEVVDRGSPPTPPPDGETKRDSKQDITSKRDSSQDKNLEHDGDSKRPPPDVPLSKEALLPTKAQTFVLPPAPQWKSDDDEPVVLQPGLWPTSRKDMRRDSAEASSSDVNAHDINSDERRMEEAIMIHQRSIAKVSSMNILPRVSTQEDPTKQDSDQPENVQESTLRQLLVNISGSTIGSDEQHMVTVDMAGTRTKEGKTMEIEHEEINMVSFEINEEVKLTEVENEEVNMATIDLTENEIEEQEVTKVEREESSTTTLDLMLNKTGEEKITEVEHEESSLVQFDLIRGIPEDDEVEKAEREESNMITIDMTPHKTEEEKEMNVEHEKSNLPRFADVPGRSVDDEVKKVGRKESDTVTIDMTAGKSEDEKELRMEREESNMITINLSGDKNQNEKYKYDETNIIQYVASRADLTRSMSTTKINLISARSQTKLDPHLQEIMKAKDGPDEGTFPTTSNFIDKNKDKSKEIENETQKHLIRGRSKTNLDPYIQELLKAEELLEDDGEQPTTSTQDSDKKKDESAVLQGTMKDRAMSISKGRRLIRVRYEEDSQKRQGQNEHLSSDHKQSSRDDFTGIEPAEKVSYTARNLRMLDSDMSAAIKRSPDDEQTPIVGSNTSITSITSRLTLGRTNNKKRKDNKKEQ